VRQPVVLVNSDLVDTLRVERLPFPYPTSADIGHFGGGAGLLSRPASLQMEVLALRHQLNVLQRSVKRPKLTASDRFFWACLAATWRDWRSALILVKPETVIGESSRNPGVSPASCCKIRETAKDLRSKRVVRGAKPNVFRVDFRVNTAPTP
jgi:hypothetical protein